MIYAWEKAKSTELQLINPTDQTGSTYGTTYIVIGTGDEAAAAIAVRDASPLTYEAPTGELLVRSRFRTRNTGPDSWEVDVEYKPESAPENQEPPEPGTWHFSFDTTGGSAKIYQALAERCRGERSMGANPAPDLKGAIGWDGQRVNGTEIVVPKLEFQITAYYEAEAVTTEFVATFARNTGRTNIDPYLGFAAGELLYLGVSGDGDIPTVAGQRLKPVKLTHKFAASENIDVLVVGDIVLPCGKKGWEYLDVKYERLVDAGQVLALPVHARVYQVYEEVAFAELFGFTGAGEEED